MTAASDQDQRRLGPFLAMMLVASGMIGSGVYLLPASLAAIGSVSILGWIAAIIGAAMLAGVFSWLAILRPSGGGLFSYIREAFGPGVGFVVGVVYWNPIGNVPIALAVTGYLSVFAPAVAGGTGSTLSTLAVIWMFIAANIVGARFVARLGGWTLLVGLAPVVLVAVGGWFFFHPAIFAASWNVSGEGAAQVVPRAVVTAFWAFLGLEYASVVAPLVRNPARDVPIATFGGLAIAAAIYLSACAVIMGILPATVLAKSSAPFADAARPLLGASVAALVAACAMLKSSGSLAGGILVVVETAESDAVLGQLRRRRAPRAADRPPRLNLVFTGVLMSLAVVASASPSLARQFTVIADITVDLNMFAYLAACAALLRFSGSLKPSMRTPVRALAAAAALFCCGVIAASEPALLLWSAGAIVAATAVYLLVRLRRARLSPTPSQA